jgi:two-component system nitrate/nitrite response regulator NarL
MQTAAPVVRDVAALSVAVLLRNEVLRCGIDAVLQSLPVVEKVHSCTGTEEVGTCDVLIVGRAELDALSGADWVPARPRILLLVNETAIDACEYASRDVDGFLTERDLNAASLSDALRRCYLGDLPMPPAIARALLARADESTQHQRVRPELLTDRELEALALLTEGLSNKQIGRRLAISSHAAKRVVASIMLKLDAPNRTTAVVNAIRAGIVDCD